MDAREWKVRHKIEIEFDTRCDDDRLSRVGTWTTAAGPKFPALGFDTVQVRQLVGGGLILILEPHKPE